MSINKYMRAALKALSHVEVDLKTNYKLIRQMECIAKNPSSKLTHRTWGHYTDYKGPGVPLRVFTPANKKAEEFIDFNCPIIIFFHGGGWVTGELDSYEKVCLTIASQTGHMVIAADYRLAPENPFPAALEDCCQTVRAVIKRRQEMKHPYGITLMGDSAGGNLAAAVSLYMRDKGEKTVDKQILIYPVTYNDHTEASPFPSVIENGTDYVLTSKRIRDYMDLYCRCEEDRNNPYLAPLLADDFSNQPDTLIITAQYDPLRDEGEEYGRRLSEAGNRVITCRIEDVPHGYFTLPLKFSAVKDTYKIINQFLSGDDLNG